MESTSHTSRGRSLLELRDILVPSMLVNAGTTREILQSVSPPTRTTTCYRVTLDENNQGFFLVPLEAEVDMQSNRRDALNKN
jgi:hypothetical protein